jgi:peptidoglycan/LPS O-acetylase OafA/YrhL
MSPLLIALGVIAVIVVVIVRRFRGEPVDAKDLAIPPLILLGLAIKELWGFSHWTPANVTFLTASVVVGVSFGMLRGSIHGPLRTRDGTLHQKYTVKTMIIWACSLLAGLGLHFGAQLIGAEEAVRPMTLSIGLSLLGEAITCGGRGPAVGHSLQQSRRDAERLRHISTEQPRRPRAAAVSGNVGARACLLY